MDIQRKNSVEKPTTGFLDLSAEVRELIYEIIFKELKPVFIFEPGMYYSPLTFWGKTLPEICFVNRQVHAEALPTWFRCTLFVVSKVDSTAGFENFCTKYDLFKDVRYLKFEQRQWQFNYDDPKPLPGTPATRKLVKQCRGLRELTYEILDDVNPIQRCNDGREPTHDIVYDPYSEPPFDLSRLLLLQLLFALRPFGSRAGFAETFKSLELWYTREFKKCGKTTAVLVTFNDH